MNKDVTMVKTLAVLDDGETKQVDMIPGFVTLVNVVLESRTVMLFSRNVERTECADLTDESNWLELSFDEFAEIVKIVSPYLKRK